MRISDWSSDVCSSDLLAVAQEGEELPRPAGEIRDDRPAPVVPPEVEVDRNQRLPAHGVGAAAEQHLDLMIVKPRRMVRQIAVALEMNILDGIADRKSVV